MAKEKLKEQNIELNEPIPSLPLSKLKFKDNKWKYIYTIKTPVLLTSRERKTPLYFTGSLISMELSNKCPKHSTNLEVHSKEELLTLFEQQRKSDLKFRKEFKEKHLNDLDKFDEKTFILDNKSQNAFNKYIVKIKSKLKDKTIFVGRC